MRLWRGGSRFRGCRLLESVMKLRNSSDRPVEHEADRHGFRHLLALRVTLATEQDRAQVGVLAEAGQEVTGQSVELV
ncbi:MAG: hypothetical protein AVDCRST_MAG14-319 [uncultured Rubrobacteraceae bacterium]|uniref:Uncharacterized protein n=1 Tax=uncultured Rubrobacteraceae bacterium TaxID=349277 RepID=A0A6J4QHR8_9ACTN|nr:MAG: hypothetical protein AVDCRST_MAG14-319 [uncultured Rubrobacteraceae bacterium]